MNIRLATENDIPAIEALIHYSVHGLQGEFYSAAQREAALGPVFGVDRVLIRDGTYFLAEIAGQIVGCGGWSRRRAVFGGDQGRETDEGTIDPASDAARIRAFFVHPDAARQGIGSAFLRAAEEAIRSEGFQRIVMAATLPGEALYARHGYEVEERYEITLEGEITLPLVRMAKSLTSEPS